MQADNAMHLPVVPLVFPQGNKATGFGYGIRLFTVVKFMQADCDGSKAFDFMDFNTFRNQFPPYLATDVGFNTADDISF